MVEYCLCLTISLIFYFLCFTVGALHYLMLIDEFLSVHLSRIKHGICLILGISENGILIADNLLVFFYLIRSLEPEFTNQFLNGILFNDNLIA